jgi:hypothetical protein
MGSATDALRWTVPPDEARQLREILCVATSRPPRPDWESAAELVLGLGPDDRRAVIGYGSWFADGLRQPASFPDFYLVIDDYADVHRVRWHVWMNRVLPPNVHFLWESSADRRRVKGKYNIISAADLERECGPSLRDVYNAGRLTKLVWIAWVRDEPAREWLLDRLLDANRTLMTIALALLPERFTREQFSLELLAISYRGEARLEGWERVRALHAAHATFYAEMHGVLLAAFARATGWIELEAGSYRKRTNPAWAEIESLANRMLFRSRLRGYLRWPRIILTEPNLIDLAASEAERKAGVRLHLTPRLRRHPLIFGLPEFRRVLRQRSARERIARP